MNYNKKTVYDVDVKGKKVLVRCDFNVPQDKKTGEITSDKRIVAAIPTLKYLLEQGGETVITYVKKRKAVLERILKNLELAEETEVAQRRQEAEEELRLTEEALSAVCQAGGN